MSTQLPPNFEDDRTPLNAVNLNSMATPVRNALTHDRQLATITVGGMRRSNLNFNISNGVLNITTTPQ